MLTPQTRAYRKGELVAEGFPVGRGAVQEAGLAMTRARRAEAPK